MSEQTNNGVAPILVTGGSGTLGKLVVERLRDAGRPVRVLSRESRANDNGVEFVMGDLATGEGADAAAQGTEIVLHLAGSAKGDGEKAHHLAGAARRAGIHHLIYISVVGADRIPVVSALDRMMFGYFEQKRAAERIVEESGLPWTTLRATQFHELTFKTVQQMSKMPLVPVPSGIRFQPIAAAEVADRLVELALGPPSGLVPELGGPGIYEMIELARSYLQATNRRRPTVRLWMPGKAARAFREGANLTPDRATGRETWEEFLATQTGSQASGRSVPA